jgi:hypothetical protein
MPTATLPKTLSFESGVDLLSTPINLHLTTIYILVDRRHPLRHLVVRLLAFFEDLEDQVATNCRVVGVAKVLIDALLEGFDAFA